MVFDGLTLKSIANKLENTYGVHIVFEDTTLSHREFKGIVPADSLEVLLQAFTKLYDIHIENKDEKIIFREKVDP